MINNQEARLASEIKDMELTKRIHDIVGLYPTNLRPHIPRADHRPLKAQYLKSAVYGGLDGIITTYAVVMGALGASLSNRVVLILGLANLIGDGISMSFGDYLSSKAEVEFFDKEKKRELWEVEHNPDGEIYEMVDLYKIKTKGMQHDDAVLISQTLSKYKEIWIDSIMIEELGLLHYTGQPWKYAMVTFLSFQLFGIVPLLPFIVSALFLVDDQIFTISTVITGCILFILGVSKSYYSCKRWYIQGIEVIILAACATGAAFLVGLAFESV